MGVGGRDLPVVRLRHRDLPDDLRGGEGQDPLPLAERARGAGTRPPARAGRGRAHLLRDLRRPTAAVPGHASSDATPTGDTGSSTTPPGCTGQNGAKHRAVLEVDGEPRAYVVYRLKPDWKDSGPQSIATVMELVGLDPAAEQALWEWVFSIDLVGLIRCWRGPVPHPLALAITEPRRLNATVNDGMWLRILDVPAALAGRTYQGPGSLVLELTDDFMPANAGRWQLTVPGPGAAGGRHPRARVGAVGPLARHQRTGGRLPRDRPLRRARPRRPRPRVPPRRDRGRGRPVGHLARPVQLDDVLARRPARSASRIRAISPIDDHERSC